MSVRMEWYLHPNPNPEPWIVKKGVLEPKPEQIHILNSELTVQVYAMEPEPPNLKCYTLTRLCVFFCFITLEPRVE